MSPQLLGLLFGAAATLTILGLFRGNRTPRISRRVEQISGSERSEVYEGSFNERIIEPTVHAIVSMVSRLLPTRVVGAVASKLEETGGGMQVSRFMAIWIIFAFVWAAIGSPMLVAILPIVVLLVVLPAWVGLYVYAPWPLLRRKAQKRVKQIERDLPDAIDLIVTSVESGLGPQAAMMKVTEHLDGPISLEFARASQEVSLGRSRAEALQSMGDRCGSRDLRSSSAPSTRPSRWASPSPRCSAISPVRCASGAARRPASRRTRSPSRSPSRPCSSSSRRSSC